MLFCNMNFVWGRGGGGASDQSFIVNIALGIHLHDYHFANNYVAN